MAVAPLIANPQQYALPVDAAGAGMFPSAPAQPEQTPSSPIDNLTALRNILSGAPPSGWTAPGAAPDPVANALFGNMAMQDAMSSQPPPAAPQVNPPLDALRSALNKSSQAQAIEPPTLPEHNNNVVKGLGLISALMGGDGGVAASNAIAQQQATDYTQYARKAQVYDQQAQQGQVQQEMQQRFVQQLAGLDPASQQHMIEGLTPQGMASLGITPQQIKSEFYDANGNFTPLSMNDKPGTEAQIVHNQNMARAQLYQLTPSAQANVVGSYKNDPQSFQSIYGMPYPAAGIGQTQAAADGSIKTTDDTIHTQNATVLNTLNMALKRAQLSGNTPAIKLAASRLNEAIRHDKANELIGTARLSATLRGQSLAHDDRAASLSQREQEANIKNGLSENAQSERRAMFVARYGGVYGKAASAQYDGMLKQVAAIDKRITALGLPGKDPLTGTNTDINGNPVPSLENGAGKQEYQTLMHQRNNLNERLYLMTKQASADAPAPVSVNADGTGLVYGNGKPARGISVPAAPPLPKTYKAPAFNPAQPITSKNVGQMSTGDILRRLAYKYRGLK